MSAKVNVSFVEVNVSFGARIRKSNGELEMVGRKRRERMEVAK